MPSPLSHLTQEGFQAFERKDYAAALDAFRSVLGVRPDFADILHHAGLCMIFLGQLEDGLAYLDRALEVNPAYIEAHINRALMLQELGRYDEAREAFDRARQHEEQSHGRFAAAACTKLANGHTTLADMYMEADAIDDALAQYRAALVLRPGFHDIRNKYAAALIRCGRLDEAADELLAVLEANPRFVAARLHLGLVRFRQGRVAEAESEWRRCEAQHPGSPQVRAYLAMLEQMNEPDDDG
jgi:tetratricopeptide (TPR) repeat protein